MKLLLLLSIIIDDNLWLWWIKCVFSHSTVKYSSDLMPYRTLWFSVSVCDLSNYSSPTRVPSKPISHLNHRYHMLIRILNCFWCLYVHKILFFLFPLQITIGSTYRFQKLSVWQFDGTTSITTSPQTVIIQDDDANEEYLQVQRRNRIVDVVEVLQASITMSKTCGHCTKPIVCPAITVKFIQCQSCRMRQPLRYLAVS